MLTFVRTSLDVTYFVVCELRKDLNTKELECLLFLIQNDSIRNTGKQLYPAKIYIYEKDLYIQYISDLLRVNNPLHDIYYWWVYDELIGKKVRKYVLKYRRCNAEEIVRLADEAIELGINKEYIQLKEYNNKGLRRRSRYTIRKNLYKFSYLFKLTILSVSVIFMIVPLIMWKYNKNNFVSQQKLFDVFIIGLTGFSIDFFWTIKWMRPTEYEKKHNN